MTDDQKLTEAEIEAFQRDHFLADSAVPADQYPRLWNISAGMVYSTLSAPLSRVRLSMSPYRSPLGSNRRRIVPRHHGLERLVGGCAVPAAHLFRRTAPATIARHRRPWRCERRVRAQDGQPVLRVRAALSPASPKRRRVPRLPLVRSGQWPYFAEPVTSTATSLRTSKRV